MKQNIYIIIEIKLNCTDNNFRPLQSKIKMVFYIYFFVVKIL